MGRLNEGSGMCIIIEGKLRKEKAVKKPMVMKLLFMDSFICLLVCVCGLCFFYITNVDTQIYLRQHASYIIRKKIYYFINITESEKRCVFSLLKIVFLAHIRIMLSILLLALLSLASHIIQLNITIRARFLEYVERLPGKYRKSLSHAEVD